MLALKGYVEQFVVKYLKITKLLEELYSEESKKASKMGWALHSSGSINSNDGSHHIIMALHKKPRCTNQSNRLLLWKQSSHQLPRDGGVSWRPNDMCKCKAPQQSSCTIMCPHHFTVSSRMLQKLHQNKYN